MEVISTLRIQTDKSEYKYTNNAIYITQGI